jgi:signal transduction histidine kinase
MLSVATPIHDTIEGLATGADNSRPKSVDLAEHIAQIRALARRAVTPSPPILGWGDPTVDGGPLKPTKDESKRICDTLDGLLRELEVAVDAQQRFVANASHELRTALTLNQTLLESVLADSDANEQSLRAVCEELLAAGAEHERLLESLLTLASSERRLEHREPIDLRQLTDRTLAAHREAFERRSLTVSQTLAAATISGETRLIGRLVANLIDNAVQHNVPGGHITATTMTEADRAILTVANSGDVIPADQLDRLLEPFHLLAPHRSAAANGHHGLGLSIVNAIAVAHDSTLTVRCHDGGGLAVTVAFKAHVASNTTLPPGAQAPALIDTDDCSAEASAQNRDDRVAGQAR